MGLPIPSAPVLRIETDQGLTHGYPVAAQSQLLSGNIGDSFFTANATLATASTRSGQAIHVTSENHAYVIESLDPDGVTLNVTPPLTQNYTGAGLRPETASLIGSGDAYSAGAAQATEGSRPCYLPEFMNGLDVVEFPGGTKMLSVANYQALDGLFANGGTIAFVVGVNDAGAGGAGRLGEKRDTGGTAIWNIVTTTAGGGFCKLLFNQITSGTAGAFATTGSVLVLEVGQFFFLSYDASTPTVPPIIHITGTRVNVETTSEPTGTASSDVGGAFNIGNRAEGDRGANARFAACYAWNRVLNDYERKNMERYLAAKHAIALYFDKDGTRKYFLNRSFFHAEPNSPAGKPLGIFLHGGGGSAAEFAVQMASAAVLGQAMTRLFLDGTLTPGGARTWNSNLPLPSFGRAPDVRYIVALINYFIALGVIDPLRIYIIAHSNGAMMAYRLAIEYPDLIAGVYCISAAVMVANPNTYTGKIRHVHGADDANVPLVGGVGSEGNTYPVPQTSVQAFTNANSGAGVTAGTTINKNFFILPSPAEHTLASIKTAFTLAPYSTTLQDDIYNFIFG